MLCNFSNPKKPQYPSQRFPCLCLDVTGGMCLLWNKLIVRTFLWEILMCLDPLFFVQTSFISNYDSMTALKLEFSCWRTDINNMGHVEWPTPDYYYCFYVFFNFFYRNETKKNSKPLHKYRNTLRSFGAVKELTITSRSL